MRLWQTVDKRSWNAWEKFSLLFFFVFVVLFLLSFSFPHFFLPDLGAFTHSFFERLSTWFAVSVLHLKEPFTKAHISDSTGFYVNALFLLIISFIIAAVWRWLDRGRRSYKLLFYFFWTGLRYYLSLQLLVYGANKIFKWQFYLPEPNTLYTSLGQLSPDIMYWSAMGTSRTYSVITGTVEIVAALLLLSRRGTLAGALVSLVALLNIFIINISFDVSVKLYTLFLLLLCFFILSPYTKNIYSFLVQKPFAAIVSPVSTSKQYSIHKFVLKAILISLLLIDVLAPYIKNNNYNDDAATRPFLHGAYDVTIFVKDSDTLPPLLTNTSRWRRVFIHRNGYFIVQYMNDSMQDYELSYDTTGKKLWLSLATDSVEQPLQYSRATDGTLQLKGNINGEDYFMELNKLNLNQLPALQKNFHWTIDY